MTRHRIAKEAGLSTGTVFNTIRDWETKIGLSNAMDIREFAVMVKKSGVSIDKCAKGFRMAQLLKYLGIRKIMKLVIGIMMTPRKSPRLSKSYTTIVKI